MSRTSQLVKLWKVFESADDLFSKVVAKPKGVTLIRDIPYADDNEPMHKLDLAKPDNAASLLPVILQVHGGGWVGGSKEASHRNYGMSLAKEGYAVLSMNYRLAPDFPFPTQIEDIFIALNFIYDNYKTYGFDLGRIFLVGDSAGAHLVSIAALIATDSSIAEKYHLICPLKLRGIALCCGVYDFDTFLGNDIRLPEKIETAEALFGSKNFRYTPFYTYSSVLRNLTTAYPPCFIMGTKADPLFPETQRMIDRVTQLNIRNSVKVYNLEFLLPHCFHIRLQFKQSVDVMNQMLDFFAKL